MPRKGRRYWPYNCQAPQHGSIRCGTSHHCKEPNLCKRVERVSKLNDETLEIGIYTELANSRTVHRQPLGRVLDHLLVSRRRKSIFTRRGSFSGPNVNVLLSLLPVLLALHTVVLHAQVSLEVREVDHLAGLVFACVASKGQRVVVRARAAGVVITAAAIVGDGISRRRVVGPATE